VKRKSLMSLCLCLCVAVVFFSVDVFAAPVPDTGQSKCYDVAVNVITCPSPGQALYGQDANYTINPMSYTKLSDSGGVLSDSAASWVMVRDNVTGLIWENKTVDGTIHDKNKTFTWYDSNPATNGGYAGTPGDGTDTEDFINALNSAHFGGYYDWRLPTINELDSIVNCDIPLPTINAAYFPNTVSSNYWSSTTYAGSTYYAWGVNFNYGYDHYDFRGGKNAGYFVRAVRGGQ
jgi:hypothetical protein